MSALITATLNRFKLEANPNVVALYAEQVNKLMDLDNDYHFEDAANKGFDIEVLLFILETEYDRQTI